MGRQSTLRRSLSLAAAVVFGFAASVTVAPAEPALADSHELRILSFNICGSICDQNRGVIERPGSYNDVVDHVVDVLDRFRPHIAVLNEVCQDQHWRIVSELKWKGHWVGDGFHAQRDDPRCEGDDSFGDSVLTFGPVHWTETHDLPNPESSPWRSILCLATTHHGQKLLACGLHLAAKDPYYNGRQVDETVRFVRERSKSTPVVIAGDFNAQPHQLRRLTAWEEGGFHRDVDQADGEPTHHGRKIDHAFLPNDLFGDATGDARWSEWSDHSILYGWATMWR